jgi:ABC-type Zn uptake system ZnuABC Zn-binding protein ZnuA
MNTLIPRLLLTLSLLAAGFSPQAESPLRVAVTTPDVQSLAERLGGEQVRVFCFTRGPEDPHEVDIRPSHVRELNETELLIQVKLGLEEAWLPDLLIRARNDRIRPGQSGHLDLSQGIRPLTEEEGAGTDSVSLHEEGNPHYLLDPVEGLKAARLICNRFVALRPEQKATFEALHREFVKQWAEMYFGTRLANQIDWEKLEDFDNDEMLEKMLEQVASQAKPGDGVVGMLGPYRGTLIVGDHDLWPYFARRHGLVVLGYLEPSPGVPPTTRHLAGLVKQIQEKNVRVILTAPYFDSRHGRWVSDRTGAQVVAMAHQAGGRPDTADYLEMIRFNAQQLAVALRETSP